MYMNEYLLLSQETASYPELGYNIVYPALGLAGEAGEVAEKVKKLWRNNGFKEGHSLDNNIKEEIAKELGDVLWYIAAMCNEMNIELSYVAELNLEKLKDRKKRGVIKSEGDNR